MVTFGKFKYLFFSWFHLITKFNPLEILFFVKVFARFLLLFQVVLFCFTLISETTKRGKNCFLYLHLKIHCLNPRLMCSGSLNT